MSICDTCHRAVSEEKLELIDAHTECTICRGLEPQDSAARYYDAADLAEDFGIYDPEEHGMVYVDSLGWRKA